MSLLPRLVGPDIAGYLDRLCRALEDAIGDPGPFAGAVVLAPAAIATTDTRIYHGLKRKPLGYWIVKAPADVRVFDGLVEESRDPANYFTVRLSSAATVTLAVF